MKNLLLILVSIFSIDVASPNPLKKTDPEHAQLTAMGYDISDLESGSIIERNNTRIFVVKSDQYTLVSRFYRTDPAKVARGEYQLLKLINKLNRDLSYTLTIGEDKDSLICSVAYRGTYDRKSFATVVSEIERCNVIFDIEPAIMEFD
jgi:hypothetical protein